MPEMSSKQEMRRTPVLVVGLGKSGLAAVRYLLAAGARVSVSDARPREKVDPALLDWLVREGVATEWGGHTEAFFRQAERIVASPGVPLTIPPLAAAVQRGVPVIGELELACRALAIPSVAITGTNGKSTVTALLGDIFRAAGKETFVGGNIGTPLLDHVLEARERGRAAEALALEVSSYQLDTAPAFKPRVGILLNITPDHLDRYASFADYAASKFRIFANQGAGDVAVANADDPEVAARLGDIPRAVRTLLYGRPGRAGLAAQLEKGGVRLLPPAGMEGEEAWYPLAGTLFAEEPNLGNAAAAILAARSMGIAREAILTASRGFRSLPHRLALVAEKDGVRYYDDSKATNVGAVHAALAGMRERVVLIAGGRDKEGGYGMLEDLVREKVGAALLIGEAKERMAAAFAGWTRVELLDTLEAAVHRAAELAAPGEAVLLSPACASFDMFDSYSHRGDVFRSAVLALPGAAPASGKERGA